MIEEEKKWVNPVGMLLILLREVDVLFGIPIEVSRG